MIVAAGIIILLLLLVFGMPVAFALGVAGMVGLWLKGGLDMVLGILRTTPISTTSSYELITVPMFMLMAEFIIVSRIAEELFDSAKVWLGRTPAGLAISTALAGAFDNILHFKREGDLRVVEGRGRLVDNFQTRLTFVDGRYFIESDIDLARRGLQGSIAGQLVELLEGGPKTSKELRELINKDKQESHKVQISRISNTLTKLEKDGLVNRSRPRGGDWTLLRD